MTTALATLSFQGEISTLIALDREVRDNYVFTVQATDNGQTPLSGYTSVFELLDIRIPFNDYNRPFPYSPYWTGTSMEWRLMRGKIIKRLMTFAFEKTSNITSSCKPVPVQYREYENGLFYLFFRLILAKLVN